MSGTYTRFVSSMLFPLQERMKQHNTVADHAALDRSQWLSTAQLGDVAQARRALEPADRLDPE